MRVYIIGIQIQSQRIMGNQLQKQYNIKAKPLKLPGAYNFLRFTYHPILPQSIFIIKSPHKATIMSTSILILPVKQIKNFSSSKDSFALCPKCVPLALIKPKGETEIKILMYKILKTGSEIGRCFKAQGRLMVWCEEKRGMASMAPEELEQGKWTQKSKVFTSGITLLNFLACVYENQHSSASNGKKQQKKKKAQPKSVIKNSNKITTNDQSQLYAQSQQQYTAQTLPQQIKLFFDPRDSKQYFQLLQIMDSRLQVTRFWASISQGLRQLVVNMLSIDPANRVDLQTILKIPYLQSSLQVRLYFLLADEIQSMDRKQALAFMKALQLLIKQGTVFQVQILDEYIVPILISMSSSHQPTNLSAQAVSILVQVNKPPLDIIYTSFKKSSSSDKNMIHLAMQKKEKLFYLFDQERFDFILSRMLFCCYQCDQLLTVAVMATPFIVSSMKQVKFKKQIQFKLLTRILSQQQFDKNNEQIYILALKCAIQLIKQSWVTSAKCFTQLSFEPLKLSLQANIHALYLYRLLIQMLPSKQLFSLMMPKLDPYLTEAQISDQLFTTAHRLSKRILQKLYQHRKVNQQDDINLEYSQEYFKLKDQLSYENKPLEEEVKKLKSYIEKNQFQSIQWIAKEVL